MFYNSSIFLAKIREIFYALNGFYVLDILGTSVVCDDVLILNIEL